jgi:ATP-dependent exoDNAse (exonuclease V) alpha subunit
VLSTAILAPEGAPSWVTDSDALWNTVEASEKRKDAQLAREFILAVPPELSESEQFSTALMWAQQDLVASGMVAQVSLHHSKSGKNPHVHILCTMRKLDGGAFSSKKAVEWNDVALLVQQRESWAKAINAALERAGCSERVDHRSLVARGIDREPEPKIGVSACAMKRKGIEADPKRFQEVRFVKLLNDVRPMLKAMRKQGQIFQHGIGKTWWEKSTVFMSRVRQKANTVATSIKGKWQALVGTRQSRDRQRNQGGGPLHPG